MSRLSAASARLAGLVAASAIGFGLLAAAVLMIPLLLALGLVSAVGLLGGLASLVVGWAVIGVPQALAAAATLGVIGFASFTAMVVLYDAIGQAWRAATKPRRPSQAPLRISLA